jgi:hypothetical protein
LSNCTGIQTALDPAGASAIAIHRIWLLLFWVSAVVWVLVILALVWAMVRRRGHHDLSTVPEPQPPAPSERRIGVFVGTAVAATVVTLIALTVVSYSAGRALFAENGDGDVSIEIVGHQWWWEVRYLAAEPSNSFVGANEIHIPVGETVRIILRADDVIHSFCWLATLWEGRIVYRTPLLFVLGFIVLFVLGSLTGVMVASVPFDLQVTDTFFVVAHLHYVLIGGSVFPLFAGFYYWFSKITGRMLNDTAGKWNFWLFFIGFNITFFPMHWLGLAGMPRRVHTYPDGLGWNEMNLLASVGVVFIAASVIVFLGNVVTSLRHGAAAGPNPLECRHPRMGSELTAAGLQFPLRSGRLRARAVVDRRRRAQGCHRAARQCARGADHASRRCQTRPSVPLPRAVDLAFSGRSSDDRLLHRFDLHAVGDRDRGSAAVHYLDRLVLAESE